MQYIPNKSFETMFGIRISKGETLELIEGDYSHNNYLRFRQLDIIRGMEEPPCVTITMAMVVEYLNYKDLHIDYLFQDQILNFSHLVTNEKKSKNQFLEDIKTTYNLDNPKNSLFYYSVKRSYFNTIQLNKTKETILFT